MTPNLNADDTRIRAALTTLLSDQGTQIATGARVKGLLNDALGQHARSHVLEVNLLTAAAASGACEELLTSSVPPQKLALKLSRRLSAEQGVAIEHANWAIDTWAEVLGASGRRADKPRPRTRSGPRPAQSTGEPGAPWPAIPGFRDFVEIGRGTSSIVFRATDTKIGRDVAIKVLKKSAGRDQFVLESRVIGQVGQHPNIVQVFDSGSAPDGSPYLVMQLYDGSLKDRIDRSGSLPVPEAVELVATIADAVHFAHSKKILHCDIKPANILFSEHGPGLADFGVARVGADQAGSGLSPLHAAPELILGEAAPDARVDVWSLGSTLYTALAANPPFHSSQPESLPAYLARLETAPLRPIPRSDVDQGLMAVIKRCLSKDPAGRYANAGEVARALRRGFATPVDAGPPPETYQPKPALVEVAGEETLVRPPPLNAPPKESVPEEPTDSPKPPRRWLLPAVACVSLLLSGLVVFFASRPEPPGPPPPIDPSLNPGPLIVEADGTSATLRWTDPPGGTAQFVVFYADSGDLSEAAPIPVAQGVTTHTVRDLDPDSGYCFRVFALATDENDQIVNDFADAGLRGCVPEEPDS